MSLQRHGNRGHVLPLVAIGLSTLMGFAGLSVDVGFLEYRQQAQQSATDSAAVGAAQQLLYSGCGNQSAATSAADGDARSNGFANGGTAGGGNVAITVNDPPAGGPYAGSTCAVDVSITTTGVSTWFTRMSNPFARGATETTDAVGVASYTGGGCLYLLSPTVQSDFSNSNFNMPNCGIYLNDSANFSNSTIDAASIFYAGSGNNTSEAKFTGAAPSPALAVADPCPEIPGCGYLAANPPSTTGCSAGNFSNGATVPSGSCYSSLNLSGTVTLQSGTIAVNGSMNWSNAHVSGNGVTLYMSANVSNTNFSNTHIALTAPTTGNTANVLFYRVPSQSAAVDFSNCTCNLAGVVYFPTAQVNVSNFGANYTVMIFGHANFSNTNSSDPFADALPTGATYIGQAILGA